MSTILVTGYRSFELSIFSDKDPKIEVIKKAIKKELLRYLDEGAEWFILTGNLGFEYWFLQVAKDLQKSYQFQIATIFLTKNVGENWNEANQLKLTEFKTTDFVKYSFDHYESINQIKQYQTFLINNTDQSFVFYDEDAETNLKYFVAEMKHNKGYYVNQLTFEKLNDIMDEE
ncbi:hypothetical protein HMPREF9318_01322 [Streptococcus urinalis FB127-CNA-2]|uniref:Uncharacterized protein n=1 Tax=Streptococcus urinalis 2285-97 TaxID=764291 RepID=G5KCQ0_9STRE|nr:SLOG family protein [Streptococcus urinalis]EHJ57005.1 hypothetical protein STRUR_0485 [Streptococcus urinalis 2285-97]EKS19800.1 hypothetical protein HMPREF9318_01322 [Streptococcus urinalis FB127-CNA-2]VEF31376.1 Uncharacterized protein conserved in bacteria [Streptococcus urinalis]